MIVWHIRSPWVFNDQGICVGCPENTVVGCQAAIVVSLFSFQYWWISTNGTVSLPSDSIRKNNIKYHYRSPRVAATRTKRANRAQQSWEAESVKNKTEVSEKCPITVGYRLMFSWPKGTLETWGQVQRAAVFVWRTSRKCPFRSSNPPTNRSLEVSHSTWQVSIDWSNTSPEVPTTRKPSRDSPTKWDVASQNGDFIQERLTRTLRDMMECRRQKKPDYALQGNG